MTILAVLDGIASPLDSAYKVSEAEERGPKQASRWMLFPALRNMPTLTRGHTNHGRSNKERL
jgi:hypothetical protein